MAGKTLDCADVVRFLGRPLTTWTLRDDLHNNEFRRWAQAKATALARRRWASSPIST